jgi:hypothetical protein
MSQNGSIDQGQRVPSTHPSAHFPGKRNTNFSIFIPSLPAPPNPPPQGTPPNAVSVPASPTPSFEDYRASVAFFEGSAGAELANGLAVNPRIWR